MEFTRDSGILVLARVLLERAYGNLKVAYLSTRQWLLLALARAEFIGETALDGLHYWSGARAAESGSLLRSCAPKGYRGFESPLLRNWH